MLWSPQSSAALLVLSWMRIKPPIPESREAGAKGSGFLPDTHAAWAAAPTPANSRRGEAPGPGTEVPLNSRPRQTLLVFTLTHPPFHHICAWAMRKGQAASRLSARFPPAPERRPGSAAAGNQRDRECPRTASRKGRGSLGSGSEPLKGPWPGAHSDGSNVYLITRMRGCRTADRDPSRAPRGRTPPPASTTAAFFLSLP